jgi:uncharacterized repeat protein (TIGR03803 family)
MALQGGTTNEGVIFSVDTNGSNYTVLVNFTGSSGSYPGANPEGSLILSGNTLYGMTYQGGTNNEGVIFSLDTNGSNYTDLVNFTGTSGLNPGAFPWGSLIISGDTLFGMTSVGGTDSAGVIFRFIDTNIATSEKQLSVVSGQLSVYPNPSCGKFNLIVNGKLSMLNEMQVEVYNVFGEKVYSQFIVHRSSFIVDLSNKSDGIYFYRVVGKDGGVIGEGKLIKN